MQFPYALRLTLKNKGMKQGVEYLFPVFLLGGDMMIPEDLKLQLKDKTLIWINENGEVSRTEAKAVSSHIKKMIKDEQVEKVLVDNRSLKGTWPPEVDFVWIDLMRYMPLHVKKTATLCKDVIGKIQLNYLSAQAGTTETVKAFTPQEIAELQKFLDLDEMPLDPMPLEK